MHISFLACGTIAYCVVYDEVEWTVAEVTTSDVFLFSCRYGNLEVVRLLLKFKVNPECADKRGQTPLSLACWYVPGVSLITELLITGLDWTGILKFVFTLQLKGNHIRV